MHRRIRSLRFSPPPNKWEEVTGRKECFFDKPEPIYWKSAPPSATTHSKKDALIENGTVKYYHSELLFGGFDFKTNHNRQLLNKCLKLLCSLIFRNIFESLGLHSLEQVLTVWSPSHRQTQTRSVLFFFELDFTVPAVVLAFWREVPRPHFSTNTIKSPNWEQRSEMFLRIIYCSRSYLLKRSSNVPISLCVLPIAFPDEWSHIRPAVLVLFFSCALPQVPRDATDS